MDLYAHHTYVLNITCIHVVHNGEILTFTVHFTNIVRTLYRVFVRRHVLSNPFHATPNFCS